MLTDDWYPTLTKPNVELVTDRIAEVTPAGIRTATAPSARPTCWCWRPASRPTASWRRWRSSARRAARSRRSGPASPRAYLGMSVPGFPNMFLLYGPNTNGGTGSVIYTIEAGMGARDRGAARARARRTRAGSRSAAEAAEDFDRELRAALAGTVWHAGCTNWYVDENGNDPNQWPWLWSTYRRRTERIDRGAYELA